jgi:hypothetical protein
MKLRLPRRQKPQRKKLTRKQTIIGFGLMGALAVIILIGALTESPDEAPAAPGATTTPTATAAATTAAATTPPATTTPPPATTTTTTKPATTTQPAPPPPAQTTSVYYANCDAAKAAGAAPLYRGDPGYRDALDRDHDGIACET